MNSEDSSQMHPCFVKLVDIRLVNDDNSLQLKDGDFDLIDSTMDMKEDFDEDNLCLQLEDLEDEIPCLSENSDSIVVKEEELSSFLEAPEPSNHTEINETSDSLGERSEIFCSLCKKQIPKSNFFQHRMNCSGEDEPEAFRCDIGNCGAEYPTNRGLKKHQSLVHEVATINIKEENMLNNLKEEEEVDEDEVIEDSQDPLAGTDKENEQSFLSTSDADTSSMYDRMQLDRDEEKIFQCPVDNCKSRFTTKHYLYIHTSRVHTEPVKCPFDDCNKFLKPISVNHHIKSFHQKVRKKCDNCGKLVMWSYFKTHHEKCQSVGQRNFKCSFEGCEAAFTSEHNRYSHMKSVHEKIKKLCKYCGKRISSKNISKHYKICPGNGVRRYPCPAADCDAEFTTNSYLIRHAKRAHGDLTIEEDLEPASSMIDDVVDDNELIQGIVYANASNLIRPKTEPQAAEEEKLFSCDVDNCNTKFRSKGALCCHRYSVHKPPMKCPIEGCESVFKPFNLRQHMKLVHERRRVACQNCGKLVSYTNIKLHYNNCTGNKEKKFACDEVGCEAKFWEKRGLKNHLRTVHGTML